MLVLIALGAGVFGFGHDHPGSETLDEHHCVVCHVQHTTIVPASVAEVGPPAIPQGDAQPTEPGRLGSLATLLSPPLRGPPVS